MKFRLLLLVFLFSALTVNAQSDPIFFPNGPAFECLNCGYGSADYKVGVKMGIGYGVAHEISSRFDLFGNLGYNLWIYQLYYDAPYVNWSYGPHSRTELTRDHLINLTAGGRFHFLVKKRSSLYTGLNFNFQTYLNTYHRNFGFTAEPNIGWRQFIGSRHEFFTSIGYDQHLTSINRIFKRRPGRVSFNVGFNVRIGGLGARRSEG